MRFFKNRHPIKAGNPPPEEKTKCPYCGQTKSNGSCPNNCYPGDFSPEHREYVNKSHKRNRPYPY